MIHEVMVLDHSGPAFGMILYGAALKLFVFARLGRPPGLAADDGLCRGSTGRSSSAGCWSSPSLIGVVESTMARLRLTHVPILLVAACLLSAFGIILLVR